MLGRGGRDAGKRNTEMYDVIQCYRGNGSRLGAVTALNRRLYNICSSPVMTSPIVQSDSCTRIHVLIYLYDYNSPVRQQRRSVTILLPDDTNGLL